MSRSSASGKPTKQVTYKLGSVDSVSLFSNQAWDNADKNWMIGTITTVTTTDSTITAVPASAYYTVTTLDNSNMAQPGKPTKQVNADLKLPLPGRRDGSKVEKM